MRIYRCKILDDMEKLYFIFQTKIIFIISIIFTKKNF